MPAVAEKLPAKVVSLCRALKKKDPTPVNDLPEELRCDEVLGYAFTDGLIEVGRQAYARVPIGEGKVRKGKDGKPLLDDQKRQIVDMEYRVHLEGEWSWLNRNHQNRAPLQDVLNETVEPGVPGVHARLTSAGLAATL